MTKGKFIRTKEWRENMSRRLKGNQINKGRKQTLEVRNKRSEMYKKLGIRPPSHKGKTYQQIYGERWKEEIEKRHIKKIGLHKKRYTKPEYFRDRQYALWRLSVFARDNYTCQSCGEVGGKLNAHHILSWAFFPNKRYDISNGLTLCIKCHRKTDNYGYKVIRGGRTR